MELRPGSFPWDIRGEEIVLELAAGSSQSRKPELVMGTFCRFLGIPEDGAGFGYCRLEMYAYAGDGKELATLESLGWEMKGE